MTDHKHILGSFERALHQLKTDAKAMAEAASTNLSNSVNGLLNGDEALCNQAIVDDETVDLLEKKIDRDGMDTIMKFSPVATDLRFVISTMKMTTSLERISDHAVSISKRARRLIKAGQLPEFQHVKTLHDAVTSLLGESVDAFLNSDLTKALLVDGRDEEIDALHSESVKVITQRMEQDTSRIPDYLDLLFILRFLKRTFDQACNIAEDAVYQISAHDIRHGGERPQG
jgi:phosphate transport system protein